MRAVDIIIKKRDKQELTSDEIRYFVNGITSAEIPDYQASAWAMAVLLNGMTASETANLAIAMAQSGAVIDLSGVVDVAVDKHSTGGVGDKTTLVVLPIVAACGLPVGKMSGRGLGFSGGTLDKLESIPGYQVQLTIDQFKSQLSSIGIVLCGQTGDLAPADGKLYVLRDVTGTVQSIPLIASSIMSKKIASGAQAIVLDVKVGSGAFMKTIHEARELARVMVSIGNLAGRKVICLLSNMDQPLGNAVGNSLEVLEALETLKNCGPDDFREHCLAVAAHMLVLGKLASDHAVGRKLCIDALDSNMAYKKFEQLVAAQGGDTRYLLEPARFTAAKVIKKAVSGHSGYIHALDARIVGEAAVLLGAGRQKKSDPIDHSVGFIIKKKIGDRVSVGDELFEVHANTREQSEMAAEMVLNAYKINGSEAGHPDLFFDLIT